MKEYSRSSADQEEPLPHELRPLAVLSRTMDYLVTRVMDQKEGSLRDWYDFLWNRTRGIRKVPASPGRGGGCTRGMGWYRPLPGRVGDAHGPTRGGSVHLLRYTLPVMGSMRLRKVIAEPIKMFFIGFVSN